MLVENFLHRGNHDKKFISHPSAPSAKLWFSCHEINRPPHFPIYGIAGVCITRRAKQLIGSQQYFLEF
jgi:hypothetical protein